MNSTARLLTIATLLVIAGLAVFQAQRQRIAKADLAQAKEENRRLLAELQVEERRVAADQKTAAQAATPAAAPPALAVKIDPAVEAGNAFLEKNPAAREIVVKSIRAGIAGRFYPLYAELGLDDAKVDAFEAIMSNGISKGFGAGMIGPEPTKLQPVPPLPDKECDRLLRELLGDAGFKRYQAQSDASNWQALRVGAGLAFTDTPLTGSQADQLVRLFSATKSPWSGGSVPHDYWTQIIDQARGFLDPAQLRPLQSMQAEDELNWAQRVAAQVTPRP